MAAMGIFTIFILLGSASVSWGRDVQDAISDTQSFVNDWKAACAKHGLSVVKVPDGKTITVNPITLSGPCKSSNIHLQISGTIKAPSDRAAWKGLDQNHWIIIINVQGLTIEGSGQIDGQGATWWGCRRKNQCSAAPTSLGILNCRNVVMRGLKFVNSGGKHILIHDTVGVKISQLSITAPEDSPNTDGIVLQGSQHVSVLGSNIGTGDDCVAVVGGSSDVNITKIICGPGHGISVGSLGMDGARDQVSEIHVTNSQFIGTPNGARIKTWQGGSGFARDISFQQLTMTGVGKPIVIDQYYCNGAHGCSNKTSAVKVSNVEFAGIHGSTTEEVPISLACSQTVGCTGITLSNIRLYSANGKLLTSYALDAKGKTTPPVVPSVLLS